VFERGVGRNGISVISCLKMQSQDVFVDSHVKLGDGVCARLTLSVLSFTRMQECLSTYEWDR